jgi:hypothetical protein
MKDPYSEIVERIQLQLSDLDRLVKRALLSWTHAKESPDQQSLYLDAVALNLHGFYSGIERLFELIARHVDVMPPEGEKWHYNLLKQMTEDKKDIRPAVINHEILSLLDEFRRFRHLVRNVYTFNLDPEKVEKLISSLPDLWLQVKAELKAFSDFLSEISQAITK